jgi:anti-sigma28 factor (negative regulator of flagellin synthesis)
MHSLAELRPFLKASSAAQAETQQSKNGVAACAGALGSGRSNLLRFWSEVSLMAAEVDVRTDKVAAAQAALAAGTYNVPASAVASKVLDDMLVL